MPYLSQFTTLAPQRSGFQPLINLQLNARMDNFSTIDRTFLRNAQSIHAVVFTFKGLYSFLVGRESMVGREHSPTAFCIRLLSDVWPNTRPFSATGTCGQGLLLG